MAEIVCKVSFPDLHVGSRYRSFKFEANICAEEAMNRILAKSPLPKGEEVAIYGLYIPPCPAHETGCWMVPSEPLSSYRLPPKDAVLEFKKRLRRVIVTLVDGQTRKTLQVDDLTPVSELLPLCCRKFGVVNYMEEFSLTTDHSADKWLQKELPLRVQGVKEEQAVVLKKKFFLCDWQVDEADPITLNLLFIQAKHAVVQGVLPVSSEDALSLAGLQMQATYGNYDPLCHVAGYLNLEDFLPPSVRKVDFIEEEVYSHHRRLTDMEELECKARYLRFCRNLKTYGVTFFAVREPARPPSVYARSILLGVHKDALICCHPSSKEVLARYPLSLFCGCSVSPGLITIHLSGGADSANSAAATSGGGSGSSTGLSQDAVQLVFESSDPDALAAQLVEYIDFYLASRSRSIAHVPSTELVSDFRELSTSS
eukprot:GILI01008531.1.p1 GENE.GILI01008531.1~~GILI01008531.1.p1  ORF type:complete len:426 (-),score=62.02 GILI01008531.1:76-1353(-)